ncbi:alkylresorcinol/alkylpyrone synthase [Salirhabdus euzebyi]|uniref:Alkylresorcinol/alkylpyrone synthase n=1 Tax=Salirhabdus euzebyi TaxID=394506 RepID=A0A841Q280_9BACI|nr:3-oxoacyl-[acyl-carrier-protein] synthase III C-terminal domain-containing protein [Salirhabdus euzebyi]MBB6452265.1 alkylresorcinol/alkylpyrone synthase [Salirhabdus euzebyi]
MPYIASVGVSSPPYKISQTKAKTLIKEIFPRAERELERLLPVFDNAFIEERQFVVPVEWFEQTHSFEERNNLYIEEATQHSVAAIRDCVQNNVLLSEEMLIEQIDCFLFVSSSGIATPTIDARCINELPFRDDITRIPIWGLGCAGGASGLARAYEWLKANPKKTAVLVNAELCSLAFQKDDNRKSNFIGSALFGDGVSACLLVGDESPYLRRVKSPVKIKGTSSKMKKDSLNVMGWDVKNTGFHVIFAKSIPSLVNYFWKEHVTDFLEQQEEDKENFAFLTAHPGGLKVLEAIEETLPCSREALRFSYDVLKKHGNMSSPTVLYVLKEAMESMPKIGTRSLLTALGPGFSSEMMIIEWGIA